MRLGIIVSMLLLACAVQAAPVRGLQPPQTVFAFDSLYGIAAWLRQHGREGYIGTDVADTMGIARRKGEVLTAWQRGYRSEGVLRVAQLHEEYILFMVERPDDQVYFYLSTALGGLHKAFYSIPSKSLVMPMERGEAELRFREEVLYWEARAGSR